MEDQKTTFFSITVDLPGDFTTDVDNLPEAWLDNLFSAQLNLPPESDLNPEQIEAVYVRLAEQIIEQIRLEWAFRVGKSYADFYQLELADRGYHIHVLLETKDVKGFVFARFLPSFKQRIRDRVYAGREILLSDWFKTRKTKNVGGANQTVNEGYILNYLLPKRQSELQYAWSNIEKYVPALLNISERERLVSEHLELVKQRQAERAANGEANPRVSGKTSERYMALVNWLVEHGITSEKEWIREDQESYLTHNASSSSRSQIKAALDNASKIMMLTKSAEDYLIGQSPPICPEENRVYRIFEMNGYDPVVAGSILLGWAKRRFGKRNAIWLYGPATTGKTNIAEAIAHAVPFYGCVNWTNENFPFNDCVDKMLIWWEEGKMSAKIVESAKAILGGSKVRVDQKCKASQQIDSTPVIITSNTDMTIVVDGNQTTREHRQPLEDRMFQFYLGRRLPDDFGKISKKEIREFFKWAELNRVDVISQFEVPAYRGDYKRKREPEPDSFPAQTLERTDARESSPAKTPRYETVAETETKTETKSQAQILYEQILVENCGGITGNVTISDHHDVECKHGKSLFCTDCEFNKNVKTHDKYLECPDSNKEQ
nr:MAG: replication-associated protein [Canine parvovirus]WDW25802.1 MAG: replication-associated protein [Canine parvovirus]